MPEQSKCITVSIEVPQPSVSITNFQILKDSVATTTLNKNDDLGRYTFAADVTVSNTSIPSATIEITIGDQRAVSVQYGSLSIGSRRITISGSLIQQQRGWSTIGDMLNALGLGSSTSTSICIKILW